MILECFAESAEKSVGHMVQKSVGHMVQGSKIESTSLGRTFVMEARLNLPYSLQYLWLE